MALIIEHFIIYQVGEVLSVELGNTRTRLERAYEQISSLEQTNKLALQQQELYQQEINSLEKQTNTLRKVSSVIGLPTNYIDDKKIGFSQGIWNHNIAVNPFHLYII